MARSAPKAERRDQFVDAAWRLMVSEGLSAVTLRRVAEEAGYTNGALKPYFASKSQLMEAAYTRAFDRTAARATRSIGERTGIEAIRRLCLEIMPLDEERRTEARVVVAFWEAAIEAPEMALVFQHHLQSWTAQLDRFLEDGRALGEVRTAEPNETIIDELLWALMGVQSLCWLAPDLARPRRQRALLEKILESLGAVDPTARPGVNGDRN